MIIILKQDATKEDAEALLQKIEAAGLKPLYMPGVERVVLGAIGDERILGNLHLESHPMVEEVKPILSPYRLVSRSMHPPDSVVNLGGSLFGGKNFSVIAGPCAIESEEQMRTVAKQVTESGASCLRAGAFKPRTSPYSFQGMGVEGLKILKKVSEDFGVPVATEVVEVGDVKIVAKYAAAFQVGARNMQNFRLLQALGQSKKPVILKRGMASTMEELLMAAEYILSEGNPNVILCERGIKTFETATRNTLDLSAVPYIKKHSHLPVIVDPSHGTGIRDLVAPMSYAAAACGADGLIIEVHPHPEEAVSDGKQSLFPDQFDDLMKNLKSFVQAAGKEM